MDLGHIFGNNVCNHFGLIMGGKVVEEPEIGDKIDRMQSFKIYTDLTEYKTLCHTKFPLLRCFPVFSRLKAADILATAHYMNYQIF